jgi:hypothetical protein
VWSSERLDLQSNNRMADVRHSKSDACQVLTSSGEACDTGIRERMTRANTKIYHVLAYLEEPLESVHLCCSLETRSGGTNGTSVVLWNFCCTITRRVRFTFSVFSPVAPVGDVFWGSTTSVFLIGSGYLSRSVLLQCFKLCVLQTRNWSMNILLNHASR